jgi:PAS domain S-box-containing protein
VVTPAGETRYIYEISRPILDVEGAVIREYRVAQDITERKRAEAELRDSQARLSDAIESISEAFVLFDSEERLVACNDHYREMFPLVADTMVPGAKLEDLVRVTGERGQVMHDMASVDDWVEKRLREYRLDRKEPVELQLSDGRWVLASERRTREGGIVGIRVDITERKRDEQALRSSQTLLLDAIESFPGGFILYDSDERMILCNSQYRDFYPSIADILEPGVSFEALSRTAFAAGAVKGSAENVEAFMKKHSALYESGQGAYEQQLDDGRWVLCSVRSTADGGIVGILMDITDVKRAEETVRTRDAWLKGIMENSPLEIVLKDTTGKIMAVSRNVHEAHGMSQEEIIGLRSSDFLPAKLAEIYMKADREVIETGLDMQQEIPRESEDGSFSYMLNAKFPLKDDAGLIVGTCSLSTDITEMKAVQAQLNQAIKMEAVGQLTGGIAHDFNNLLAIVMGNLELIENQAKDRNALAPYLDAAFSATDDAATLTQRLLAFSRNQPLMPKITDMNGLVSKMIGLFSRTLDDNIAILSDFGDALAPISIDPGQLENALLNLVVNARDAMPKGGEILIETDSLTVHETAAGSDLELAPGDYISLTVRDTGGGMERDVLDHVFEPFFTTKEVGEGSGLGLSMVFGFVNQSGGHVAISSKPGRGTTVTLYLPATTAKIVHEEKPDPDRDIQGDGKTILFVEDNDQLRRVVVAQLTSMGFQVHHARDGKSTLDALEKIPLIDLLLTDVKMPGGMDGVELARQARRRRPSLPVLYASGYSADALMKSGQLEDSAELIEKPFKRRALAARIASMLS